MKSLSQVAAAAARTEMDFTKGPLVQSPPDIEDETELGTLMEPVMEGFPWGVCFLWRIGTRMPLLPRRVNVACVTRHQTALESRRVTAPGMGLVIL